MPYIKVTPEQIKKKEFPEELKNDNIADFKLCYVDEIPKTIFDYRPEIRERYKDFISLPWEKYQEMQWRYPDFKMEDLPNPDYKAGEFELKAYFTPKHLDEQWGDDYNDIPYEHNAGIPYDDLVLETRETPEGLHIATKIEYYNIIVVPFCVRSYSYHLPKDYGGYNSPFSVDMINAGAVAWIYDASESGKIKNMTSIHAGCKLDEFIEKLDRIIENNPNYESYDEDND